MECGVWSVECGFKIIGKRKNSKIGSGIGDRGSGEGIVGNGLKWS